MAILSKVFAANDLSLKCQDVFHPWHDVCAEFQADFFRTVAPNVFVFFSIMYFAEYCLKSRKKLSKEELVQLVKDFFRSIVFGFGYQCAFFKSVCLQKYLTENVNFWVTAVTLGINMGLTILLETNHRKPIVSLAFVVMAMDSFIRFLCLHGVISKDTSAGPLVFMIVNALLMNLIWERKTKQSQYDISWYFKPEPIEQSQKEVTLSSVIKDSFEVGSKYFFRASLFTATKMLFTYLGGSNPKFNLRQLRLATFFGSYVGLYKLTLGILFLLRRQIRSSDVLVSGFVAGLSFFVRPSLPILNTSIVLIAMAYWKKMKKKRKMPNFPFTLVSFILSNIIILRSLMHNTNLCPNFYRIMILKGSNGRIKTLFHQLDYFSGK